MNFFVPKFCPFFIYLLKRLGLLDLKKNRKKPNKINVRKSDQVQDGQTKNSNFMLCPLIKTVIVDPTITFFSFSFIMLQCSICVDCLDDFGKDFYNLILSARTSVGSITLPDQIEITCLYYNKLKPVIRLRV